ncbi:hypothetical protein hmeg3_21770 [Herbaspirillum sp. meg3]|uniref:DUF3426 domain-containing protein n=1 Tax=Herbaspirillum sp. meg3 TaxID=2025949 RepID=UPI000B997E9A|nr:DUF3426 domain-containing protein [Herbaspirillum sp. meg3]ASU40668.1 hypothetical protein hmeg3_21770 [Herbaspirillum sp. meg3]
MALATQCPFCQTTFRVAQDQLKLRGGLVRCGSCKEVFNGNDHLVSPDIAQQLVATPAPTTSTSEKTEDRPAPTGWPKLPGNSNAASATMPAAPTAPVTPPRPPIDLSAAFASIAAETDDAPWGTQSVTPTPQPDSSESEKATASPSFPLPGTPAKSTETLANTASPDQAEQTAINTLTQELSYPVPLTSSARAEDTAPATEMEGAAERTSKQTESESEEEDEEEHEEEYEEDDADTPAFVQKVERRERLHRIGRVVMRVGAVLLTIALLLQATYVWRNTIAAWLPSTRPLLASICNALHCSVGLPTNIDQLSLESSELQLVPPNQNIYTLTVLLRNRGYSAQAWPYMELTLNDGDEKAITRRVFTPREYIKSAQMIDDGLAGEGEQQVKLTFELAQPAASGYRIYLFYP